MALDLANPPEPQPQKLLGNFSDLPSGRLSLLSSHQGDGPPALTIRRLGRDVRTLGAGRLWPPGRKLCLVVVVVVTGLRSPQVRGGFGSGKGTPHTGTAGGAAGRTPTPTRRHHPGLAPVLTPRPLGASASRLAEGVVGQAGSEVPGRACDAPPTVVGEGRA